MKTGNKLWTMVAVTVVLVSAVSADWKSSGMSDIDELREAVASEATQSGNADSRRSALLRWWRLMWRSGQDMTPFDEVADHLLNIDPDSAENFAAIDRGYKVLEGMLAEPRFIGEKKAKPVDWEGTPTDWPYYMGGDGKNNGYSPDPGPSEGTIAWRFPKGYRWDVAPVVEGGKVYLTSPGIDVMAFSLDESTGEILWRARQYGERFYGSPTSKFDPVVGSETVLIRTGANAGQTKVFSKQTGIRLRKSDADSNGSVFAYKRGDVTIVIADTVTGRDERLYQMDAKLSGDPVMDGDSVYAAGNDGYVCKFDPDSSKPQWKTRVDQSVRGELSVGEKAIYAGGSGSVLYALDKEDGSVLWKHDTGIPEGRADQYFSGVLQDGDRLYFGTAGSRVYCIDATDGSRIWENSVDDWVRARPVKKDGMVYFATLSSSLYAFKDKGHAVSGKWVQKVGYHGVIADLVAGENGILLSGRDLILYSLDYDNGNVRWSHGILDGAWIDGKFVKADYSAALPGSPTVVDGVVYIGGADGFVNAIDAETGKELWKFEAGATVTGAVSIIDGKAMFGRIASPFNVQREEDAPPYYAVDMKTGELVWKSLELGNVWIGAIERNGVMFVGDMNGYVYGVDPATGEKLWEYYTSANTPEENEPHDYYEHGWPPGVYCMPAMDDESFYTGSWSGYYFSFEHATGALRWRNQTGINARRGGLPDSAAPTLHKDHLYVQKNGHLLAAINIHTGEISWEWSAPPGYLQNGTLAGLGDRVYASVGRRVTHIPYISYIHCFEDVESGSELLWSHRDGGGLTAPVITDHQVIFGSTTGMFLTSLDPQTGELLWKVYTGGEMTENVPAIYGDMLFSVSKNGWLNAVK